MNNKTQPTLCQAKDNWSLLVNPSRLLEASLVSNFPRFLKMVQNSQIQGLDQAQKSSFIECPSSSCYKCQTPELIRLTDNIFLIDYRTQIHQIPGASSRPCTRSAHQGGSQDRIGDLPARVERQGTQRGKGPGGGSWWL